MYYGVLGQLTIAPSERHCEGVRHERLKQSQIFSMSDCHARSSLAMTVMFFPLRSQRSSLNHKAIGCFSIADDYIFNS